MGTRRVLIEVAVDRVEDGLAALSAGADRVELCANLETGGVTPRMADVRRLCEAAPGRVVVLVREDGDHFRASAKSLAQMEHGIRESLEAGAAGSVFGVLTAASEIDREANSRLVATCDGRAAVFHRAFDMCREWRTSLDVLGKLGFARLLTSGGANVRAEGAVDRLAWMARHSVGGLEILPGGGVRADNAGEIVRRTGCSQLHTSCRGADGAFDAGIIAAMRAAVEM